MLMFAERFVVHKQIDHLARRFVRGEPARIFPGRQGPLLPTAVRESESDIVRQFVIAQQQPQLLVDRVGVHIVGRLPAEHVTGSLGQHRAETHLRHGGADLIGIDELRIAESRRAQAELLVDHRAMELHLLGKILF